MGIARPVSFLPENLRVEHQACKDGLELFALLHKHKEVAWWDISLGCCRSEAAKAGYVAFRDALGQWKALL